MIQDSFTRANSTTTLGSTDTGQVWTPQGTSTWGITSNQAYLVNTTANQEEFCVFESGLADVRISIKMTVAGDMGIPFRFTDSNNCYTATSSPLDTIVVISKVVGGVASDLGTATNYTAANGDVLTLLAIGNSYTLQINGVTKFAATDATFLTQTIHGIKQYPGINTQRFDEFSLTAIGSNALSYPIRYRDVAPFKPGTPRRLWKRGLV